jgi:transposase
LIKALQRKISSKIKGELRHLAAFSSVRSDGDFVGTVDSFQGSETDLVILSLVRNNPLVGIRAVGLASMLCDRWDAAVREAIEGHSSLPFIIEPLLIARAALRDQVAIIDKRVRDVAKNDHVCRRLMTVPGVGPIVALTYRAAVDDPKRFTSSKSVGASFGLTPRRYQSGETDRVGAISRAGDPAVRVALFEAAHVMMVRSSKWSTLKVWAIKIATRRGLKRAKVALARKLAVILHRMWIDETDFRFVAGAAPASGVVH